MKPMMTALAALALAAPLAVGGCQTTSDLPNTPAQPEASGGLGGVFNALRPPSRRVSSTLKTYDKLAQQCLIGGPVAEPYLPAKLDPAFNQCAADLETIAAAAEAKAVTLPGAPADQVSLYSRAALARYFAAQTEEDWLPLQAAAAQGKFACEAARAGETKPGETDCALLEAMPVLASADQIFARYYGIDNPKRQAAEVFTVEEVNALKALVADYERDVIALAGPALSDIAMAGAPEAAQEWIGGLMTAQFCRIKDRAITEIFGVGAGDDEAVLTARSELKNAAQRLDAMAAQVLPKPEGQENRLTVQCSA